MQDPSGAVPSQQVRIYDGGFINGNKFISNYVSNHLNVMPGGGDAENVPISQPAYASIMFLERVLACPVIINTNSGSTSPTGSQTGQSSGPSGQAPPKSPTGQAATKSPTGQAAFAQVPTKSNNNKNQGGKNTASDNKKGKVKTTKASAFTLLSQSPFSMMKGGALNPASFNEGMFSRPVREGFPGLARLKRIFGIGQRNQRSTFFNLDEGDDDYTTEQSTLAEEFITKMENWLAGNYMDGDPVPVNTINPSIIAGLNGAAGSTFSGEFEITSNPSDTMPMDARATNAEWVAAQPVRPYQPSDAGSDAGGDAGGSLFSDEYQVLNPLTGNEEPLYALLPGAGAAASDVATPSLIRSGGEVIINAPFQIDGEPARQATEVVVGGKDVIYNGGGGNVILDGRNVSIVDLQAVGVQVTLK